MAANALADARIDPAFRKKALDVRAAIGNSELGQRLRSDCPAHIGVVYYNRNRISRESLAYELQRMKDLGFTFVRFHDNDLFELGPGKYDYGLADMRMDTAAEVGIGVYPHFLLEEPSPAVLESKGLTIADAKALGVTDARVAEAVRTRAGAIISRYRNHPALLAWPMIGEPGATRQHIESDADAERFRAWLLLHYKSAEELNASWSTYPDQVPPLVDSWESAVKAAKALRSSEVGRPISTLGLRHESYGLLRDLMRFRADQILDYFRSEIAIIREFDKEHPISLGNHQMLINNAQLCWDIPASGGLADMHYSSIHLSWHFEQSLGEVDRPAYMHARFTKDAIKGGASAAYETTAGPVQYSGGYGNHMDDGLMRRLMCSYLAAGNQSIAFWVWTARPGGVESGEYGFVTQSGALSRWALEAGTIARAMQKYTREIWHLDHEPELGILRSWDTEAILTIEPQRFDVSGGPSDFSRGTQQQHTKAIIGASRVALDDHIAFEYLSEQEILGGIAGVYPSIYLPHVRACSDALLDKLREYVEAGGRLIADVQVAFQDPWGRVRRHGKGLAIEKLFGAWVDSIHDSRTRPQTVDGISVNGFYGDIVPTRARVIKRFGDGRPAVTEAVIGRGQALLLGFDAAHACWRPGQSELQRLVADLCRGDTPRRWWSDAPMAFRRTGPSADHWFLVNDGCERHAILRVWDRAYRSGQELISGETVDVSGTISVGLPEYSAVWLRLERAL